MKIRIATVDDVSTLNQLHFDSNNHRHALQPKNFQRRSVDEELICRNIKSGETDYIVLEINGLIRGMALVEMVEGKSVQGSVRYRFLEICEFIIDSGLSLETYGHELMKEVRRWGRKRFLSYIQLNILINDEKKLAFFEKENLCVTQQTLKCVI